MHRLIFGASPDGGLPDANRRRGQANSARNKPSWCERAESSAQRDKATLYERWQPPCAHYNPVWTMGRPKWVSYILVYIINKRHGLFWNKSEAFLIIGLAPIPPGRPVALSPHVSVWLLQSICSILTYRFSFFCFFPTDKRPLS